MSDDLNIRQPQDPKQVNVKEDWELKTWTKHFGVTAEELKAAVVAVGTHVDDVTAYFQKKKR